MTTLGSSPISRVVIQVEMVDDTRRQRQTCQNELPPNPFHHRSVFTLHFLDPAIGCDSYVYRCWTQTENTTPTQTQDGRRLPFLPGEEALIFGTSELLEVVVNYPPLIIRPVPSFRCISLQTYNREQRK